MMMSLLCYSIELFWVWKKIWAEKVLVPRKILCLKKILCLNKILGPKKCWVWKNFKGKNFCSKKNFGSKKNLCVTNRFLVCADTIDFGGGFGILVTWVIWTPTPLNSVQSPWVGSLCVKFQPLALPHLIDFGGGSCSCSCSSCDRVKQSQLLV